MLVQLFTMFCFRCKSGNPTVEMKKNGTSVTVEQYCEDCGGPPFTWRSQPLVLGKYPAGNILLSFAILLSGASISKIYLVFKHMGVSMYNMRTYFIHQKKLLFPVILYYWEKYRSSLVQSLKGKPNVAWYGDGRYDSVGHSAKYRAFTMFCSDIAKIVHFELLQANEAGSSSVIELLGAKKCFEYLMKAGLNISVFVSDRHSGIAKWLRESHSKVAHFYDIWHFARSVNKKLLKVNQRAVGS